jgi:uncharacterized membrane protein
MSMTAPKVPVAVRYNLHWHVIFTHFPISFFMVSAGFMAAHLFTMTECFEMAGFLTLAAGTVMLVPTTITGWTTWKSRYKGANTYLFRYKIRIAFAMLAFSIVLIIARGFLVRTEHNIWHFVFGVGFLLLFIAAMAEGYYGGRLNHHP